MKEGFVMGFKEIASSPLIYILVIIGLAYIVIFSGIYLKKAYARCIELGFSKTSVMGVIKGSAVFAIVPSLAIVVGFFSLAAILGIPWSWWRLSVIGSVMYELMASNAASGAMGYPSMTEMLAANDAQVFGAVMILMTIGILSSFFILLPFGKKMCTGLMKSSQNEKSTWGTVLNSTFMLSLMAVMLPLSLFGNIVEAATLITSAAITGLLGIIIKKFDIKWLGNFVMAIAMIGGMASSVMWTAIF